MGKKQQPVVKKEFDPKTAAQAVKPGGRFKSAMTLGAGTYSGRCTRYTRRTHAHRRNDLNRTSIQSRVPFCLPLSLSRSLSPPQQTHPACSYDLGRRWRRGGGSSSRYADGHVLCTQRLPCTIKGGGAAAAVAPGSKGSVVGRGMKVRRMGVTASDTTGVFGGLES